MAVGGHALHHIVEWLGVHHVVEVVRHFDGSVTVEVAVCLDISHLVMTGESGNKQHNILGYVLNAKHDLMSLRGQRYTFIFNNRAINS